MRKRKLFTAVVAILLAGFFAIGVAAEGEKYRYTGTSESGNSYTINGKKVGTAKFNMTDKYIAYCVDLNTVINKNTDYIKLALEDNRVEQFFTGTNKTEKIRAILNYAWGKTGANEVSAIQLALWEVMHGPLNLSLSGPVKTIYEHIMNLPSIPASDEIIDNTLTMTGPTPALVDEIFSFYAATTENTEIIFEVKKGNTVVTAGQDYTITYINNGEYLFTWLGERESNFELTIKGVTTKSKAVNAWVFASVEINEEGEEVINFDLSQTVVVSVFWILPNLRSSKYV